VRLVRFLPKRFQSLAREALLFLVIGVVNTIIDYAVLNTLLVIGPLKAKVVATIVSTTASYFMNRHWTYGHRDAGRKRREYAIFVGLNIVGFAINLSLIAAAKYGLDYSELDPADRLAFNIANAVGIGLAMVFRFFTYRLLVFKEPTQALQAAEVAVADAAPATQSPTAQSPVTEAPVTQAPVTHAPTYPAGGPFRQPDRERLTQPSTAGANR
jgi:putative flippase GtrA